MSTRRLGFKAALGLFNCARFFDAHEALEDLWRGLPESSPARKHFQGLIQLSVAFHHESRGNLRGARSVLDRGLRNLAGAESSFPDLDISQLRHDMIDWQDYFQNRTQRPAMPQIRFCDSRA
jgi:predicted metal-dependent hydrolase